MNPTYTTVTLDRIHFVNYGFSSNVLIDRTLGIERNLASKTTYIPTDVFIVHSTMQSLTSVSSPLLRFTNDLDTNGAPKNQIKAFTDALHTSLSTATFPTLTVNGNATFAGTIRSNGTSHLTQQIYTIYYNLLRSNVSGATGSRLYHGPANNMYIENFTNDGIINMVTRDMFGGIIIPIKIYAELVEIVPEVTMASTLYLNGSTSLICNGGASFFNLSVTGNFSCGALFTGLATLQSLSVTNASALSTLTTSGLATLNSLAVTNASTLNSLAVTNVTTLSTLTTSGLATLDSLFITNASASETVTINAVTGIQKNLTFNGTTATDRSQTCCYYNIQPTQLTGLGSRIYQTFSSLVFETFQPFSSIFFTVKDASSNAVNTFICFSDQVQIAQRIVMAGSSGTTQRNISNVGNLIFEDSQNAKINQTSNNFAVTDYSSNVFKKSSVRIRQSNVSGSSASAFEIVDEVASPTIRGFVFIPNSSNGAYNNLVTTNDNVLTTRTQDAGGITISPWSTLTLGLRIAATSSTTATCILRAGGNLITINETSMTFTSASTTALTVQSTNIVCSKPLIQMTPTSLAHPGFVHFDTIAMDWIYSSTTIRNIASYQIANAGTYLIMWRWEGENPSLSDMNVELLAIGIARSGTSSLDNGTPQGISVVHLQHTFPTITITKTPYWTTQCSLVIPAGGWIYFNYYAKFTGTSQLGIGGTYSITRII